MNENSPAVLVLWRRTHGAERDCQVVRETTEPHAVDYVRVCLDAWGLSEVLFKRDSESATQALVDEMQVERSEETMVEESPKYLYQLGSEAEDTAQMIESLTQACARVLREKLGLKVASKSIASSRPDRQVVLSQTEKRDDGHGTWSRIGPLAQVDETLRFKVVRCEMAELESRWVTRACLDRAGEGVVGATAGVEFFQPLRRPAKDDQCQRDGFIMSVPWDTRGPTGKSMAGNRKKNATKSLIQDEAPRGPVHLEASLREMTQCQRTLELPMNPNVIGGNPAARRFVKGSGSAGDEASEEQFVTHPDTVQQIRQTTGTKRGAEDDVTASPAKRAHTVPFPLTQALLLSATGRKEMLVPRDAMRISTQFEEYVCRPNVKVFFDAAGEFRDHYNGEVLDWSLKITGTDNETTRTEKSGVPIPYEDVSPRNRRQRGSPTRTCSTDPRKTRSGGES